MTKNLRKMKKGSVDRSESFDSFLARERLLTETEHAAIKEIIADQDKATIKKDLSWTRWPRA